MEQVWAWPVRRTIGRVAATLWGERLRGCRTPPTRALPGQPAASAGGQSGEGDVVDASALSGRLA